MTRKLKIYAHADSCNMVDAALDEYESMMPDFDQMRSAIAAALKVQRSGS